MGQLYVLLSGNLQTWAGVLPMLCDSGLWIVERWLAADLRLLVNLRKASLQDWLLICGIWLSNTFFYTEE